MLLLADIGCVVLVTFVVPVIPMMVFGSNDLGGEFSQSDSLLTHALVGIPGITGHLG